MNEILPAVVMLFDKGRALFEVTISRQDGGGAGQWSTPYNFFYVLGRAVYTACRQDIGGGSAIVTITPSAMRRLWELEQIKKYDGEEP